MADGVGVQTELAQWLLEQIAVDERRANYAIQETTGRWTHRETDWGGGPVVEDDCGALILPTDRSGNAQYPHIAAWDPARVLAECEAKRKIVELADEASGLDSQVDSEFRVGIRNTDTEPYVGDLILRQLALPYADRPGYVESWRLV